MPFHVTKDMLSTVLFKLEEMMPATIRVFESLKLISECETDDSQVVVDDYPHLTTLMISYGTDVLSVPAMENEVKFFSNDATAARIFLIEMNLFADETINFAGVPSPIWPVLQEVAEDQGYNLDMVTANYAVYRLHDLDLLPKSIKLPADFNLDRLYSRDVPLLVSKWASARGQRTHIFMDRLIAMFPSACVRKPSTNQLVAFAIFFEDGSIGHVFVEPSYRRMGLAIAVVSTLAPQMMSQGRTPWVSISLSNIASINLHRKLGFKPIKERSALIACNSRKI